MGGTKSKRSAEREEGKGEEGGRVEGGGDCCSPRGSGQPASQPAKRGGA